MNISKVGEKQNALFISHVLTLRGSDNRRSKLYCYSTLGGKTDKLDEAVDRELNVTRS